MSTYEQAFSEVCSLANSKKITDKKKCITKLQELYNSAEAIKELHANSRNKKGTTWTAIMHAVHKVLLDEADRSMPVDDKRASASTSKSLRAKVTKDSVNRNNNSMTILETIKKANSSEIILKCDDLVSLVLQIFSSTKYVDYQKTYLTILINQILTIKQYQTDMESVHWKELLKISISLYEEVHRFIDKNLILRAICMIVQHGCRQSHLILYLKKIFPFLVKVFNDAKSDPRNLSENTFKIANAVCQAIGPESRAVVCDFGETVLRSAIDLTGSCAKYDWILLIVQAHHPGGVSKDHDASYACNWEKWNDILRLIYCMIINDYQSEFASESFVQLACEVSWQLKDDHTCIDDHIHLDESCYQRPPKRRRTIIGTQGMIDVLTTSPIKESKLSIRILIALMTQYPESITESNFLPFMEYLIDYLNTCKDEEMIDLLWELGRVMLQLESKLPTHFIENPGIKLTWEKIWSITLRSVCTNKYKERVHKLLQSLISHKKVIDSNAFLNLYLKNPVIWSKSSVNTLLIFCKHNIIQDYIGPSTHEIGFTLNNHVPVKVRLLRWVLDVPQNEWSAQFPIEDVCELLVGLTLKSWYNISQSNIGNTSHQSRLERQDNESENEDSSGYKKLQCDLTSIESTHLLTEFEGSLCSEANTKSISHCKNVKDNVLYAKENRELLISNLIEKNTVISESGPKAFLIVQTAVIAKVFSNFKQLNIAPGNINELFVKFVKNSLQDISLLVEDIVASKKKLKGNNLINVLDALYLLYKTPYDKDIADIIRSSTMTDMLMNILLLTKVENLHKTDNELGMDDNNTKVAYIKNIDDLSDSHRLSKSKEQFQKTDASSDLNNVRLKACTILATFCGMVNGGVMSSTQRNLQIALLNPEHYDLTQIFDLKMATIVLETLTDCEIPSFSENLIENSLNLLKPLCRRWYKNEEVARNILNILSKLLVHLNAVGSEIQKRNLLKILNVFHSSLQKKKYGPMVYMAFIQCLETIAKIDPIFAWTKWPNGCGRTEESPVVQDLAMYIQSPFHVVRLKTRNCLHILFASKDVNLEWLTNFFTKLRAITIDLFVVREELEERVKEDERTNRTRSALHMMAVVISSSAIFRSEALLSMLQLIVDKNINPNIVKKVLERVSASLEIKDSNFLVEDNLNYLLTCWLEKEYTLRQFPVALVQCTSEQLFDQKYIHVIVPILIQKGDLRGAQDLCNGLGMSFKDVIENCFPRLISWILPYISADPSSPSAGISVTDIKCATNVFNQLKLKQNEFQTVENISTLLENNLESIILTMIKRLHDKEHSMQFLTISVNYPSSDPPHFKHEDIERSFKYLENHISGTKHSLLYLLATAKQHILQKVLLNLKCSIHEAKSVEHKLKTLHHYVYFSMMISKKIDHDYFDEMSAYIVRDICHTMVYFIKESSDPISEAAYSYFYHLLQLILPKRRTEIDRNLRLIVASMIPIVKAGRTTHAPDIIKFLIAEQTHAPGKAIEGLDSLTVDKVFQHVREIRCNLKDNIEPKQSLKYEIQHFLNTRGENTEYCNPTELEHLKEQLSMKKIELREMYQSLRATHRFSEDCASSMLHQLICALVKLTTSSDPDISLRVANCLGEIGPADLSTMILQPERSRSKPFPDSMLLFTYRVVVLLSNLLIHADVQLCISTSEALYIIAASCWGKKINDKKYLNDFKALTEGSEELLQIEYIRPFISQPSQPQYANVIDKTKFNECVNNRELWIGKLNTNHKDWITNITCSILDCFNGSYLKNLIPVCRANVSFCEKILPWIIHLVIDTEKKLNTKIYYNINLFFNYHFSKNGELKKNSSPMSLPKHICFNHKSVQCMLNVVDFIRSQSANVYQFELNYLHMAKAAQYCSAYFTSVLYAELWCEKFRREDTTNDNLSVDYICEIEAENGRVLQEILKEACIKIGDPDAIYGCGSSDFQNPSAKIEHYVHLRKWDKVLLAHDIELSLGNKTATKGLLDALQHSGLQYLLGAFVKTIDKGDGDIDSNYRYECAWRLSDWNMPTTHQMMNLQQDNSVGLQSVVSNDYPLFHYHALKSFHESDTDCLKSSLDSARVSIIKTLRNISLESCKTIYPALSQLQMLREIEEIYFAKPDTYNLIIEKWNNQDSVGVNDFEYFEPILSQRTILLRTKGVDDSNVINKALVDTYLQVIELSKKDGYFQMTARALASLAKQVRLSAELSDILQYQEAMLSWMRGDQELGRHLLRNLIAKQSLSLDIHVQALTVYGNWMAETKSENPQQVIQKYYRTALKCSKKIKNPTKNSKKNLLDAQAALAQFADTQYQQIQTYTKSPQFESFKECIAYSEKTADKLSAESKNYDERKAASISKKQSSNDMAELENIEREKNMYLLLALEHYIFTLQQGEDHNLLVFRLVSLWLDNTHHTELSELLDKHLDKLPSYKFVLLVPQLAPHMTDTNDVFPTQIYSLLRRCAIEHPHHTLPVLLSLMNLHKDHEFNKSKKRTISEPRVLGAKKLIEHLTTTDIKPIIEEMRKLSHSLIMLANFETSQGIPKNPDIPVPTHPQSILQIKNFKHTLVPTLSIDIKPNKKYEQIISIEQYVKSFELVGGVNAPKKVTCIGTDGIKRSQLVKGKDDLRQDAVMQQVFTVMNMLLRTSKEANKRKLSVRTYKVVPLTQRCGILEWCDNTMPISAILEGSPGHVGLHKKYYPNDYTTRRCREQMGAVAKRSNEEKLEKFIECCKNLHPVFHYFFLESFSSPEIWFERRLAYVHSVATTSIIGYVLGLGDRHVNNILIDRATAEVIHIDFGIAFEQGKVLPTPETVPFRLTRDIEAAMGVSGVEGVLRRSCEETMVILRNHREVIITLLQVLLYDPLFSWAITPAKAYSLQKRKTQESSEGRQAFGETNKFAERALLRLDLKLRGTEEGSASSIAGQIEKLIQEARDPVNLSRLYPGWQPYL